MAPLRRRNSPPSADWVVVGLGNPGREYDDTRHNVGQATVALLAERAGERLKGGRDNALIAETRHHRADGEVERLVLAVPITYMNESGRAVAAIMRRHRIDDPTRLVVIHDELDLEPGDVRVKSGGGLAGHNGLRSITDHLRTQDYLRVRIGVGKPPHRDAGARHVLNKIPSRERPVFDLAVATAADAALAIVDDGFDAAARAVNAR